VTLASPSFLYHRRLDHLSGWRLLRHRIDRYPLYRQGRRQVQLHADDGQNGLAWPAIYKFDVLEGNGCVQLCEAELEGKAEGMGG